MLYIHPATLGDAQLISSTVPEADYPVWSAGTAYATGDRVIRTTGVHRIFERLAPGGTSATAPEAAPASWLDVGPTARWAMFDKSVGTVTSAASSITVVLDPGQICEGLALLDLDCESVTITATVGGSTVYTATLDPVLDTTPIIDWYSYFFESIARRTTVIITDLPPYFGMQISITIAAAAGTVSCGTCVVGRVNTIGDTQMGASLGIVDYSKKSTDDFGATTVVERGYANRMTVRATLAADALSQVTSKLKAIRAVPVVWIGADGIDSTVIYGWCKDWGVDLQYRTQYHCSLTVEGLV